MRARLTFLALAALLVCAALLPGPARAQSAEDEDRGYIQGLLEDALSAEGREVRLEGFRGALSSTARIDRIVITDPDGVWLTAEDVSLQWRRAALLRGRIDVQEIRIARLALPRPPLPAPQEAPTPEARGPITLPDLPVSVELETLTIDTAEIGAPVIGEALQIGVTGAASLIDGAGEVTLEVTRQDRDGRFRVAGSFANETRRLTLDLDASEPAGGLIARLANLPGEPALDLTVAGDGPLDDFTADLALATDGTDRLTGTVTLLGETGETPEDGTTQRFTADLSGDIRPLLAAQYHDFLGDEVALSAAGAQSPDGALTLDRLDLAAQALRLQGSAALRPDGWPARFDLDVSIDPPVGESVLLPLPGDPTRLRGLSLEARFDAAADSRWRLEGGVAGLGQADFALDDATFTGSGRIDRTARAVTGGLDLVAAGLMLGDPALQAAVGDRLDGTLRFDWSDGTPLRLSEIDLSGADYGLRGAVDVAGLVDGLGIVLTPDLSVKARDLARFAELAGMALAGAAGLDVTGEVTPLEGAFDLDLAGTTRDLALGIAELDPLLAGDGTLRLRAARDTAGLRIPELDIATAAARVSGSATVASGDTEAQLSARLTDTARALPGLNGPTQLDVAVTGRVTTWRIDGTAAAPGQTALDIAATLETDPDAGRDSEITVTGRIGALAAFSQVAGQPLGGAVTLDATGRGDLGRQSGTLSLQARTTDLAVGVAQADALLRGPGRLSVDLARAADGTLRISNLDLDASGLEASGSGRIGGPAPGEVDIDLRLPDLGRVVALLPGPATLQASARQSGSDWSVTADGNGPGNIAVQARGTVAGDAATADLALTGRAPLALANEFLQGQSLDGDLSFDLALRGAPGLDALSGRVDVSRARVSAPALQITLEDVQGGVQLAGARAQVDLGGRFSTGGRLRVTGPVALAPPFDADLTLGLRDAVLRQADLVETTANGEVRLSGALAGGARIGGDILLEPTEVQIPNIGPSYAALDGLTHEDLPADVRQTLLSAQLLGSVESAPAPSYPIDLTVRAPSRIFVRGRGLDAELGGQIRLTGRTDALVPIGQFDLIRGRLELLSRNVVLDEGSISLRGSFDPVMAFSANTSVEGTVITIGIEGPASAPEPSFTSNPELPEDEVLSLFLFGRSVTEISALQAVRLAAALRTLSGQGGLGIAGGLREGLGVDNFDVGIDDDGNAEASVGTYISDNVYTDVTVNSEGESEVNLNLELTDSVTVRGRGTSEGESALGIFFERDY